MADADSIIFYDIASREPRTTFAANPWKARLALNLKAVKYETKWVEMPDIASVREGLGLTANRTLPDGSPFHTLPVIQDLSTRKLVGDSFEIALYLDSAYPQGPSLFRPGTVGLTAAFNAHVDGVFTKFVGLCAQMPFDPKVLPDVQAIFAKRVGAIDPAYLLLNTAESHDSNMVSFEAALGELAKAYRHTGGTTDYIWRAGGTRHSQAQQAPAGRDKTEPFLDGEEPTYSDIIVTAWLKMFEISMPAEDWQRVRTWQGGLWGNVVDAMSAWSKIK